MAMTDLQPAFIGLIGVLFGSLLVSYLQRRNWQRQEAMKAYASLFHAGAREIETCSRLTIGGKAGWEDVIRNASAKLPSLLDSPFLQSLMRCWLLEKDREIRGIIETLDAEYPKLRDTSWSWVETWEMEKRESAEAGDHAQRMAEKRTEMARESAKEGPTAQSVLGTLNGLKQKVAKKYFH
jgi:hypothetical protein